MVVIRLARGGNKHRPFYNVVVADSRERRDGRFIVKIGHYNPLAVETDTSALKIDLEKLNTWVSKGAKVSDTVAGLVKKVAA